MIQALVYDSGREKSRVISISTCGHGQADVCNGVSAIVQAVESYFLGYADSGSAIVDARESDGRIAIDVVLTDDNELFHAAADAAVEVLARGLTGIELWDKGINLEVEWLVDLPFGVSKEDCIDQVRAWRRDNGFDRDKMTLPKLEKVNF